MNLSLISFLIALLVISFLIVVLMKQKAKPTPKAYRPSLNSEDKMPIGPLGFDQSLVRSKWIEIQTMQNSGPSGLKSALIDADKLLDYCMIAKGFAGDTMGERLKLGGHKFNDLNAVWGAHKLRNQIAHDIEHDIVPDQVKRAIDVLGVAIGDLGVKLV